MRSVKGFRLESKGVGELGAFIAGFRADALRVLVRQYGQAVGEEASRLIDLHRVGVQPQDPDGHPLRDATGIVREAFLAADGTDPALDFDCELALYLVGGHALLRIIHGQESYRRLIESRPGVRPFHWSAEKGPPKGVSEREWEERGRLWAEAFPTPRLGTALRFRLVDGPLPAPRWTAVRRATPDFDMRVRRTAYAKAWMVQHGSARPSDRQEAVAFRHWLKTAAGAKAYEAAKQITERLIPRTFEREDLVSYGEPPKLRPRARQAEPHDAPTPIDHADVMEAADGRVFVAVMDAGLSPNERVFIQVSERQIAFVQAGRHFGCVDDTPLSAIDLLRSCGEVTIVEIRRMGDRREVKARHVALVRDASLSDYIGAGMHRWRTAVERGTRNAEKAEWAD